MKVGDLIMCTMQFTYVREDVGDEMQGKEKVPIGTPLIVIDEPVEGFSYCRVLTPTGFTGWIPIHATEVVG